MSSTEVSSKEQLLRPAIKSPSSLAGTPVGGEGKARSASRGERRVNFPADESLVTGYLEPPNPWEKALNSTPEELLCVYKLACETLHIKPLAKVIHQLQKMGVPGIRAETLSLKGEKLDTRHFEALEEIFKRIQFQTIDVESTNLDDDTAVALFDMIEYYESAKHLNISSNKNLNTRAWQACAKMLKKTHCLESLDARGIHLSEHYMMQLCRTLRTSSNLTALHLENCNMSGRACSSLMMALKLNSGLRELYLADNKLTATDALQIGNLLRSNTRITHLDLHSNHVTDTGVGHIVDGLNDQSMGPGEGLQSLVLWSNQLTYCSSTHLAKAVASYKSLKNLNIGNNSITNEGVFQLKEALMKNRSLIHLSLQQSKITCEGAVALAEYIADNPSIQMIDLRDNNIRVAGLLALSHSMKVNRSVSRLDLDKDPKKETQRELQDQHQRLLVEIMESCEQNHQEAEKLRAAEKERLKPAFEVEETEKLSESVCRLLSLFDQVPSSTQTKSPPTNPLTSNGLTINSNNKKRIPDDKSPTPLIILPPDSETSSISSVSSVSSDFSSPLSSPLPAVNPGLLSPPPVCPSPPKSRFRVSRVLLDTDTLISSAGNTPMPSPVSSPGHSSFSSPSSTPFASPGCSPFPSPIQSPMGSPLSSPFRNGFTNSMLLYPSSVVISKTAAMKPGLVGDPMKKRALKLRSSSPNLACADRNVRICPVPNQAAVEAPICGIYAPPTSPASTEPLSETTSTFDCHTPPNTPVTVVDEPSWLEGSVRGSESWTGSSIISPISDSCLSLSSSLGSIVDRSPTPQSTVSVSTDFRDEIEAGMELALAEVGSCGSCEDKWSVPVVPSPSSEPGNAEWGSNSIDSGVVTPDVDQNDSLSVSSASSSLTSGSMFGSSSGNLVLPCSPMSNPLSGFMAPPSSPICRPVDSARPCSVAGPSALYSSVVKGKRSLSPSVSSVDFDDTGQTIQFDFDGDSPVVCLQDGGASNLSPTSPAKPSRKKKRTDETTLLVRDIKLAEPSCVRLFGGGIPSGGVSPLEHSKDIVGYDDEEEGDNDLVNDIELNDSPQGIMESCAEDKNDGRVELERRQQIEMLKKSLEESKVFVSRRASTGSFPNPAPGGQATNTKAVVFRRTSMTVDDLIQKQLIELQNSISNPTERKSDWRERKSSSDDVDSVNDNKDIPVPEMIANDILIEGENAAIIQVSVKVQDGGNMVKDPLMSSSTCSSTGQSSPGANFPMCHVTTDENGRGVLSALLGGGQSDSPTALLELGTFSTDQLTGGTVALALIHSDVPSIKSPVRQRLLGSGSCVGEGQDVAVSSCIPTKQEMVAADVQRRAISAITSPRTTNIMQIFETADILSRPSQESTTAETLKT